MSARSRQAVPVDRRGLAIVAALLLGAVLLPSPADRVATAQDILPGPLVHEPTLVRVELPDLPDGQFTSIIASDRGFIAVGYGYDSGPLIYVTEDLVDWVPATLRGRAAQGQIRDIVRFDGGYAAVGGSCCPDEAAVWLSADGRTWRRIATTPELQGALMLAVTTWQGDLHAVGCSAEMECFSGLHWASTDGRTWSYAGLPNEEGWLLDDVASDGALRLLMVGREGPYSGAGVTAATADGETWTTATIGDDVELIAARIESGAFVACGRSMDAAGVSTGLLLRSQDAIAWPASPITSPADATFTDLHYGGGILLAGWQQLHNGDTRASVWVSVTGEGWHRIPFATPDGTPFRTLGRVNAMAGGATSLDLVAVGAVTGTDGADEPAIWVQW
jgi:hypothetical protein